MSSVNNVSTATSNPNASATNNITNNTTTNANNNNSNNNNNNNNKDKDVDSKNRKPVIDLAEWQRRLNQVSVAKQDLNRLVMNYLVIEGYKDAAEKFSAEAQMPAGVDLASIEDRMRIRHSVQGGKIEEAIERVNDLDPEILDTNPRLYFHLQQQRLIEFIRCGDLMAALDFAQDELAPRGEENPEFLEELEKTMALLAFEDADRSPVGYLLDHSQRQKTASELNAAILTAQCQEKDPKLPSLLRMLIWTQQQLREKVVFPEMSNFMSAQCQLPGADPELGPTGMDTDPEQPIGA